MNNIVNKVYYDGLTRIANLICPVVLTYKLRSLLTLNIRDPLTECLYEEGLEAILRHSDYE